MSLKNIKTLFMQKINMDNKDTLIESSWNRFIKLAHADAAETSFPRKSVFLDADLHKTCKEIKIPYNGKDISINDLVNSMVRTFIETHLEQLRKYRSLPQSIFDNKI